MQPIESTRRFALFTAYQIALALGILLLPPALLLSRAGLTPPVGRLVAAAERAYENAAEGERAD